jgi:hypothetical protein
VKVADQFGQLLFSLSTHLTGESFDILPAHGTVYCLVPELLLAPDTFSTTGICFVNNELSDLVQQASQFAVVEGNYLGAGRITAKRTYGSFILPHRWSKQPLTLATTNSPPARSSKDRMNEICEQMSMPEMLNTAVHRGGKSRQKGEKFSRTGPDI